MSNNNNNVEIINKASKDTPWYENGVFHSEPINDAYIFGLLSRMSPKHALKTQIEKNVMNELGSFVVTMSMGSGVEIDFKEFDPLFVPMDEEMLTPLRPVNRKVTSCVDDEAYEGPNVYMRNVYRDQKWIVEKIARSFTETKAQSKELIC